MTPLIITAVVIIGIFAALGAFVWLSVRSEDKRNQELARSAAALGFTPLAGLPEELNEFSSRIALMNSGHGRQAWNVYHQQVDDFDLFVFDYQYVTGGSKAKQISQQTVALIRSDAIRTPRFLLRPESLQAKLIQALGGADIDFADDPDFSKKYVLQGDDEAAIRRHFHPQRRQSLVAIDGLCLESQPGCFLFWFDRRRVIPENLSSFVDQATRTRRLLCD